MRTYRKHLAAMASLALALAGCVHFGGVEVITKEEALQNQIAGVMEDLGDDVMLYESVRAVDEDGEVQEPPQITDSKQRVIEAMQSRQFNADDIRSFLAEGCARETNRGLLDYFQTESCKQDAARERFVKAIIAEENDDRMVIMRRVIDEDENMTDADLPRVQSVFAAINQDAAQPGVWVQDKNGAWAQKPSAAGK